MSKIDIRNGNMIRIERIVFADDHADYYASELVINPNSYGDARIEFLDSDNDDAHKIRIEDIPNLIKALEKVLEVA